MLLQRADSFRGSSNTPQATSGPCSQSPSLILMSPTPLPQRNDERSIEISIDLLNI